MLLSADIDVGGLGRDSNLVRDDVIAPNSVQDESNALGMLHGLRTLVGVTVVEANDFTRLDPLGGLIFVSTNSGLQIKAPAKSLDIEFFVAAGQTISVSATATDPKAILELSLMGMTEVFSALAPGAAGILPTTSIDADGVYAVRVSSDISTNITVDIYRNASLETPNDDLSSVPQSIEDSLIQVGLSRYAVVGNSNPGINNEADTDRYTIDLMGQAGRTVDIVLAGHSATDFSRQQLQLLGIDGVSVLATAIANPLGIQVDNFDLAILNFQIPDDGIYTIKFASDQDGSYSMVVTNNAIFDSEKNDFLSDPLRSLNDSNGAFGFLGADTRPGSNLITDGGFELDAAISPWSQMSTNFNSVICDLSCIREQTTMGAHGGQSWAWFGGATSAEQSAISQEVVFPVGLATLAFFLRIPEQGYGLGSLDVMIDGNVVLDLTDKNHMTYPMYRKVFLSVSQFGDGEIHTLSFKSHFYGGSSSHFFVDDVELYGGLPVLADDSNITGSSLANTELLPTPTEYRGNHEPGRLIIQYDDELPIGDSLLESLGGTIIQELPNIHGAVVDLVNPAKNIMTDITRWTANEAIVYAQPDYKLKLQQNFPNDTSFPMQWGLHNTGQSNGTPDADIDAPEAWDVFTGSQQVVVASLDTGIDYTHPELSAQMWVNSGEIPGDGIDNDANGYVDDIHGIDTVNNDSDPMDDNYHGTHTAGIFGAIGNNGAGLAGVNWDVGIMAIKFLDEEGDGATSDVIEALNYITMMKTRSIDPVNVVVTNSSWGGTGFSALLHDAISASIDAGILFVTAAGNDSKNNDQIEFYPSTFNHDGIISVAATTRTDNLADFSNYGSTTVDLGAPGENIYSTIPDGSYATMNGTSMAAPHVSGAIALMAAAYPEALPMQIKGAILEGVDTTDPLIGRTVTGGRLNISSSLALLGGVGPTVANVYPSGGLINNLHTEDLLVEFSKRLTTVSAEDVKNYQLLEAGPNGIFEPSGGDDMDIPVSVTFNGETKVTLTVDVEFSPLALGQYQLRISNSIEDLAGNSLNQSAGHLLGLEEIYQFKVIFQIEPGADLYHVDLREGQALTIETRTPFDGGQDHVLDPALVIIGPYGRPVASDKDSLDGRNATVSFKAEHEDLYTVMVFSEGGSGEYLVTAREKVVSLGFPIPGDINLDGMIDLGDLAIVGAQYGSDGNEPLSADLNHDGIVDVADLSMVGANLVTGKGASAPPVTPASSLAGLTFPIGPAPNGEYNRLDEDPAWRGLREIYRNNGIDYASDAIGLGDWWPVYHAPMRALRGANMPKLDQDSLKLPSGHAEIPTWMQPKSLLVENPIEENDSVLNSMSQGNLGAESFPISTMHH